MSFSSNHGPLRHTIPQLNVPDYILSAGGIDISVRQFLFAIFAVLADINLWLFVSPSTAITLSNIVSWTLIAIPIIVALIFGWVTIQGQPLEIRLLRMMRYYGRPHVFVWQRSCQENLQLEKQK